MPKGQKKAYKVGTKVKSSYKAPWTGVVIASGRDFKFEGWRSSNGGVDFMIYRSIPVDRDGKAFALFYPPSWGSPSHPEGKPWTYLANPSCVYVRITHDKNGQKIKARYTTLHCHWLTKVK